MDFCILVQSVNSLDCTLGLLNVFCAIEMMDVLDALAIKGHRV